MTQKFDPARCKGLPKRKPILPPDSPTRRAYIQACACRAAGLDDWQAGWIAGVLQASDAEGLPVSRWRKELDLLIADCTKRVAQ